MTTLCLNCLALALHCCCQYSTIQQSYFIITLMPYWGYWERAVYLRSWLISITTGRSSCPRQADRLSFTLCVLQVTAPAQSRPTCLSLSLTHTMCAPGHSSCAEQADLSFSCTPAAPHNIPDMPTRKQCVLSRVHACMWRVR